MDLPQKRSWGQPRWLRLSALVLLGLIVLAAVLFLVVPRLGRQAITVGGFERTYRVHLPTGYDGSRPAALVMLFHQYGADGWAIQQLSGMDRVADANGFIVVYPDGYQGSWNEGSGKFAAEKAGVDDVAFTNAMLDALTQRYAIDPNRIYAAGFSNGGFMAQRLACELSDRISAIAVVGATMTLDTYAHCRPQLPVSVLMIHGKEDTSVPWNGNDTYMGVTDALGRWVSLDRCKGQPIQVDKPDLANDGTTVSYGIYSGCMLSRRVALYAIEGGNHSWPGGSRLLQFYVPGNESYDIDASTVIWEFLRSTVLQMPAQ